MTKYGILIADANATVRKLLSVIFEADRYSLTFASDGEEAMGLAMLEPPQLVIAELRLDRLDGVSLCERLKSHPRTSGVKVVILTTATSRWDLRRAKRAGADGYVTKPFSPAQLLDQCEALLKGEKSSSDEWQNRAGRGKNGS